MGSAISEGIKSEVGAKLMDGLEENLIKKKRVIVKGNRREREWFGKHSRYLRGR